MSKLLGPEEPKNLEEPIQKRTSLVRGFICGGGVAQNRGRLYEWLRWLKGDVKSFHENSVNYKVRQEILLLAREYLERNSDANSRDEEEIQRVLWRWYVGYRGQVLSREHKTDEEKKAGELIKCLEEYLSRGDL